MLALEGAHLAHSAARLAATANGAWAGSSCCRAVPALGCNASQSLQRASCKLCGRLARPTAGTCRRAPPAAESAALTAVRACRGTAPLHSSTGVSTRSRLLLAVRHGHSSLAGVCLLGSCQFVAQDGCWQGQAWQPAADSQGEAKRSRLGKELKAVSGPKKPLLSCHPPSGQTRS